LNFHANTIQKKIILNTGGKLVLNTNLFNFTLKQSWFSNEINFQLKIEEELDLNNIKILSLILQAILENVNYLPIVRATCSNSAYHFLPNFRIKASFTNL